MNKLIKLFQKVYKGKRILITGHTGFTGSWLTLWLLELGAKIIGYALKPPTNPNLFEIINLEEKIIHTVNDIKNEKKILSVFDRYQPEFIFHLAAQPLVRLSYKKPRLTYETNIMGTVNLLEALRKNNCAEVCIIITSDKCYENKEWIYGYREIDPMGGYDPYSSSKGCVELITNCYRRSFFNPKKYGEEHHVSLSSARAGNIIGGGDWSDDRLIPDCIKALFSGDEIVIRNPTAIRPWQYVLEPLYGYLLLGALMCEDGVKYSSGWNFGPENENLLTVEEVIKFIIDYWDGGRYRIDSSNQYHEAKLLKLDTTKAKAFLSWNQTYAVHESLQRTINWYKAYYDNIGGDEMIKLTKKEITDFIVQRR